MRNLINKRRMNWKTTFKIKKVKLRKCNNKIIRAPASLQYIC